MHIEINSGGLSGITIAEYQSNMSNLISDAEKVISSFKAVSNYTYALSGGAGNLQDAISDISSRVQHEIEKKKQQLMYRRNLMIF